MTRLVCVFVLAVAVTACSTTKRIPLPDGLQSHGLRAGDNVNVTMQDGRSAAFKVQTVEPGSLVAVDGRRYEIADIVTLERIQTDWNRTLAGLSLAIAGLIAGYVQ